MSKVISIRLRDAELKKLDKIVQNSSMGFTDFKVPNRSNVIAALIRYEHAKIQK
jgi:metal-responsive CopG/Arc/MetJ family transcriptional regulator